MSASLQPEYVDRARQGVSSLAVWVMVLGVLASTAVAYWVWNRTAEAAQVAVEDAGGLLVESITEAIESVTHDLIAVAGLYQSSEEVTRLEFTRFVRNLGVTPGVAGIAYAPIVERSDVDQFLAAVRTVVPDYEIFEFAGEQRVPAGERDRYVPIQWSHPDRAFGGVYGFDLESWAPLAASVEDASASGTAEATGLMALPDQPGGADWFAIVSPVRQPDSAQVDGFTVALLDMGEFLDARIPDVLSANITWRVFDASTSIDVPDDWWTTSFPVVGDHWSVAVSGVEGTITTADRSFGFLVLLAGVLASLLAGYGVSAFRQKAASRIELERLRELSRAKDQFLASVSHELRTPLTGVVGFTELLREPESRLGAAERRRMIDSIARESTDMAAIIDDLLVAARSELDMVTVTAGPVEMRPLVEEVLEGIGDDKVAGVAFVGPDDEWPVTGDPARIRQIVRNLVVNACRYGGDAIEVRLVGDGTVRKLQVADSGPALPSGEWERIFEPYHRVHRMESKPASLGIGLSISRHLSRLMGGDLIYRHEAGWSVFELTLLAATSTSTGGPGVTEPAGATGTGGT